MKTLWNRFKYTVLTDIDSLLDNKESKNPIALLNQYVREAEKQTASVGKLLERQSKLKLELQKELELAEKMVSKRRKQLDLARAAKEDDLIAFAEAEVLTYETRATNLTKSMIETTDDIVSLEQKFEEMKHKVKDMKVRQLQLMGKENVARAHHQMDSIISPENAENRLSSLNKMDAYIENLDGKSQPNPHASSMELRLESLKVNAENNPEIV